MRDFLRNQDSGEPGLGSEGNTVPGPQNEEKEMLQDKNDVAQSTPKVEEGAEIQKEPATEETPA